VIKFGTKFGIKYLLHNLVPNLVMLPTCNHCCKLIRQVMVLSGFVQVMVSLWWICKFGTKFATKFDTNFGRAYLLPLLQIWYAKCANLVPNLQQNLIPILEEPIYCPFVVCQGKEKCIMLMLKHMRIVVKFGTKVVAKDATKFGTIFAYAHLLHTCNHCS
jgi:hypothetical protein